jgi:hypothetical protein
MKFILLASLMISGSAFAYHNGPQTNHPEREDAILQEKREPASAVKEVAKPEPGKITEKQ